MLMIFAFFYPFKHKAAVKAYIELNAALIREFAKINKLIINATKALLIRFQPHSSSNNTLRNFCR